MWERFLRWLLWPIFEDIEWSASVSSTVVRSWMNDSLLKAEAEGYRRGVEAVQRLYDEKAEHLWAEAHDEGYRIGFEAGRQEGAVKALEAAREAIRQEPTCPEVT